MPPGPTGSQRESREVNEIPFVVPDRRRRKNVVNSVKGRTDVVVAAVVVVGVVQGLSP